LQLATKGFNVVLVSGTQSELTTLAQAIKSKYSGIQTKALAIGFERNDSADYEPLMALVKDLHIAILIDNVSKSNNIAIPFLETSGMEMDEIITINVNGTLKITQILELCMDLRKRGPTLTMGAFGSLLPTPFLATYSSSKAFVQH